MFNQKGENKNSGILVVMRSDIHVFRLECKSPNACVFDIKGEKILRTVGVYSSKSKYRHERMCFLF